MPSRKAVWFIIAEKPSTDPPTPSASTTAMSLADFTIIILSPLSASTTSSASACTARGVMTASAVASKIRFNEEARSNGRRRCTFPFRSFETRLRKGEVLKSNVRVSSVSGAVALRQVANLYRLGDSEQRPGDLIVDEVGAI